MTNIDLSSLYMQSNLEISSIEYEETTYHLYCTCKLDYGTCPYCCHSSHRVHSRYTRTIADLSILGHRCQKIFLRQSTLQKEDVCRAAWWWNISLSKKNKTMRDGCNPSRLKPVFIVRSKTSQVHRDNYKWRCSIARPTSYEYTRK